MAMDAAASGRPELRRLPWLEVLVRYRPDVDTAEMDNLSEQH
jgi:hypothetical protein